MTFFKTDFKDRSLVHPRVKTVINVDHTAASTDSTRLGAGMYGDREATVRSWVGIPAHVLSWVSLLLV